MGHMMHHVDWRLGCSPVLRRDARFRDTLVQGRRHAIRIFERLTVYNRMSLNFRGRPEAARAARQLSGGSSWVRPHNKSCELGGIVDFLAMAVVFLAVCVPAASVLIAASTWRSRLARP